MTSIRPGDHNYALHLNNDGGYSQFYQVPLATRLLEILSPEWQSNFAERGVREALAAFSLQAHENSDDDFNSNAKILESLLLKHSEQLGEDQDGVKEVAQTGSVPEHSGGNELAFRSSFLRSKACRVTEIFDLSAQSETFTAKECRNTLSKLGLGEPAAQVAFFDRYVAAAARTIDEGFYIASRMEDDLADTAKDDAGRSLIDVAQRGLTLKFSSSTWRATRRLQAIAHAVKEDSNKESDVQDVQARCDEVSEAQSEFRVALRAEESQWSQHCEGHCWNPEDVCSRLADSNPVISVALALRQDASIDGKAESVKLLQGSSQALLDDVQRLEGKRWNPYWPEGKRDDRKVTFRLFDDRPFRIAYRREISTSPPHV